MPELRRDPVVGRWVIIATERAKRPTDYPREPVVIQGGDFCPFCYGNEAKTPPEIIAYRSNGSPPNSPGWSLRVVPNKFPALGIEGELERSGEGLFDKVSGIGAHEVIIESPDHDTSLSWLASCFSFRRCQRHSSTASVWLRQLDQRPRERLDQSPAMGSRTWPI